MSTGRRLAAAGVVAAAVALAPAGVASADNNNSNTNTNDVTQVGGGDFGGAGASENTNWPPTDLGWPPKEILSSNESENGGTEITGSRGRNELAPTPIVMPSGQTPPTPTETPNAPEAVRPIVGISSP